MNSFANNEKDKVVSVIQQDVCEVLSVESKNANSDEHILKTARKHRRALIWCLYMLWCIFANNYSKVAGTSVLGIPQFRKDFGKAFDGDYVLSTQWQSAYYGAPQAAAIIGAISIAWTADKIGRRMTFVLVFVIRFISITFELLATTNQIFFVGRFLGGLATGATSTLCMTFIGEISPQRLRGILTAAAPIALILGSFIAAIVVNFAGTQPSRWAYRTGFVTGYGFYGVACVIYPFMPESPWWLIEQGEEAKAIQALKKLGYNHEIEERITEIRRVLTNTKEETSGATYAECFKGSNLRRTIISALPLTIQTFSGVAFVGSYNTYYQQLAGYSTEASFRLFIVQQILSGTGNICSWFLVDSVGRRSLTFWGMVVLTVLLLLTGGLALVATAGAIKGTVAFLLLFCFIYNATIGASAFTILTEISTSRLRAKTASLSIALQSALFTMWGFVLPYLFNPDKANLGAKVTFIFGGLSVMSLIYLWFCLPESAGLSYEKLDELFINRVPARKFTSYVQTGKPEEREAKLPNDKP